MIIEYFASKVVTLRPPSARDAELAKKDDITLEEFMRRCDAVLDTNRDCKWYIGEMLYPTKWADFVKYGMVKVTNKCLSYYTYGDLEWNDPPFILAVSPIKDPNKTINCTPGWCSRMVPINPNAGTNKNAD